MRYNKSLLFLSLLLPLFSCEKDSGSESNHSPYISKVYDYLPSAGQYVNELPMCSENETKESVLAKVSEALIGNTTSMVTLGGFGGYVVFGFDHTIENKEGVTDFKVLGNSFSTLATALTQGSSEPGIIFVSKDSNGNGLPDDEWFEIAGSEHKNSQNGYSFTIYRPKSEQPADYKQYMEWSDNQGNSGYIEKNRYHLQSYYPMWIDSDSLTFSGRLLPNNLKTIGSNYITTPFEWGYADNLKNDEKGAEIDIDWAVKSNGESAALEGIDFIKVYSALRQEAPSIGETSTEVCGAVDLHLLAE